MQATYYDGDRAVAEKVELRIVSGSVVILRDHETVRTWQQGGFRVRAASSGSYVRIESLPYRGETVVVDDVEQVRELAALLPHASVSGTKPVVIFTFAAIAVLMLAGAYASQNSILSLVADKVPAGLEERLGVAVLNTLAPSHKRLTGPAITGPLQRIVSRLDGASDGSDRFHVVVINERDVNAWAAPGGYIGVNCALIESLQTGDELAAVLAHEFNHVTKRHSTKNLLRVLAIRLLLSFMTGGDFDTLLDVAGLLGTLHFMRSDEAEADSGGLNLLVRANIDPKAMARAFGRLEKLGPSLPGGLRYLSTHPPANERRRHAEEAAAHSQGVFQPVLGDDEFREFRTSCSCL